MTRKIGPRHQRNVKSLDQLGDSYTIKYLSGDNGNVMCAVDNMYHNWLVEVPRQAFDAVARGGLTTIEEVKKYLRDNPQT